MSIVPYGKANKSIHVLEPGLLTTLQDQGRWGYQQFGVPVSGPMDRFSHRLANIIVGNDDRCVNLEVTFTGPRIVFEHDVVFGVTGAQFELTLDGKCVPMNTAILGHSGNMPRVRTTTKWSTCLYCIFWWFGCSMCSRESVDPYSC